MSAPTLHPVVAQLQPSDEQLPAILARGSDVLVSAGAGAGKTRTLTARILALLAEGTPLRSIVAVTFTIKAASEMRNRLRNEIQTYLSRSDLAHDERLRWSQIAQEIDGARIGTIHSLCSEILRVHAAEAGVDPRFTVLDESQASLRKRLAVEAACFAASTEPDMAALVKTLGLDGLADALRRLLDDRERAVQLLAPEHAVHIRAALDMWGQRARAYMADPPVCHAIAQIRAAIDESERSASAQSDSITPLLQPILDTWESASAALADENPLAALVALSTYANLPRNRGRRDNWRAHNPKPAVQQLQETCSEQLALPKEADPAADLALLALLPALRILYMRALQEYAESKATARAVDFDDLETLASELLRTNAQARAEWQAQVQAVLVDEFQDTNRRQRDLLRAISGDRGVLFLVGDAKQSIYRFRGADVRVFRSEREQIAAGKGTSLVLARSFRSHPPLLNRLNNLLAHALPGPEAAAAFVEPFAPLIAGEVDRQPRLGAPFVEVHLGVGTKNAGAEQVAANALAARLRTLHQAGIQWEEMALLCRRSSAFAPYEDAFERFDIPYVTVAGAGFHQRPEVRDLLNALRAIADPADNLALAGFLRSPITGMSDGDLLALRDAIAAPDARATIPPGAWWRALQENPSVRAAHAVHLLRDLHTLAGRVPVAELIATLLERTHYEAALVAAGNLRGARNLAKLLEDAQRTSETSVRLFLEEIADLATSGARTGEARTEAAGSVQIMTLHAAKGLQFPVVVLGDAGGRGGGRTSSILLDEQYGVLFPAGPERSKGILFQQTVELERQMEEAEAGRLLYVGATRAQELLILSGTTRLAANGVPQPDGWLRTLAPALDLAQPQPARASAEAEDRPVVEFCTPDALLAFYHASPPPPSRQPREEAVSGKDAPAAAALHAPPLIAPLPQYEAFCADPSVVDDESPQAHLGYEEINDSARQAPPQPRGLHVTHDGKLDRPLFQRVVGVLFHAALQFAHRPDHAAFAVWLAHQLDKQDIADAGERKRIGNRVTALLKRYYVSALQREIANASVVLHETPFITLATQGATANHADARQMDMFASLPPQDASAPPRGRTNGYMDLVYRRPNGRWAIVDFKVDRITGKMDSLRFLAERPKYLQQLRDYRAAFSTLTGEDADMLLCLLDDHGVLQVHEIT